ncbi:MAG TPA: bifunctional phosphopantothenoylcysteine decarboxylase/phosphopantothenate--cysteine ligase CoaBC [Acidimicrobiales bacterium]
MSALAGRRIVLGVSGGIAAYKAIEVCRRLVDAGAHVVPVLTSGAQRFVGATTFSALASEPAHTSLWEDGETIPHTKLGQSADLVVVAPATARVIGAYAGGISSDLLVATLLATRAPVILCPAMHTEMWEHPAVQENLGTLRRRGVHIVEPGVGRLAGGDVGAGRLADPQEIVAAAELALSVADLAGLRLLVTAGGTREPIDAVRVITNRSSGKQGHALADEAARRGAKVTLVSTAMRPVAPGVDVIAVETAAEMAEAVLSRAAEADVVVMAAAVADFRPVAAAAGKLKKESGPPRIELEPTVDILAELGRRKRPGQILVGFAAETDDVTEHADGKLRRKQLDLIVANDVSAPGVGFDHDTNAVTILGAGGVVQNVALADKAVVAAAVLDAVVEALGRRPAQPPSHEPQEHT